MDLALWFRFRATPGHMWRVFLATDGHIHDVYRDGGDRIIGLTVFAPRIILVDAGLSAEAREETLLHEMMHASLHGIDSDAEFAAVGIRCKSKEADAEEHMIRVLSPRLYPILRRSHWRPPALSVEARALVRRCQRKERIADDE